jgi:hypothetical protein
MKISEAHQNFAARLQFHYGIPKQEVLSHPEKYLGPNWEAVINFWLYFYTLSKEQLNVVHKRYVSLRDYLDEVNDNFWDVTWDVARSTITVEHLRIAGDSVAYDVAAWVTYELIGLQKLLDLGYQPAFFPLFLNL